MADSTQKLIHWRWIAVAFVFGARLVSYHVYKWLPFIVSRRSSLNRRGLDFR